MVSISSAKKIKERTEKFYKTITSWENFSNDEVLFNDISHFLQREYEIIPKKERVGKGSFYIAKHTGKKIFHLLNEDQSFDCELISTFSNNLFDFGTSQDDLNTQFMAIVILSAYISKHPEHFSKIETFIKKFATFEDWKIRETAGSIIRSSLKINPADTLSILKEWAKNKDENIRRLVAESLRPLADIKWLRNPEKNDPILEILTSIRNDSSIYVRKSVGNNIKDLSKYMPQKILKLMKSWIEMDDIKVHEKIATEEGLQGDAKRLIWTIKHAMRWIKVRNPEYHDELRKILGDYYILYYDEKRNKLAKPKK